MRRVTLMLAAMAVMVPLFAAVAYAATIDGTREGEALLESSENDIIFGRGGGDDIFATIFGGERDVVYGNSGGDYIDVRDADGRDTADGGNGDDVCFGNPGDQFISCEEKNVERGSGGGGSGQG